MYVMYIILFIAFIHIISILDFVFTAFISHALITVLQEKKSSVISRGC